MAFCANCGSAVEGQFCGGCGQAVGAPAAGTGASPAAAGGMTDNVAGLLCYILGFITGILFLVIAPYNQSKFVRFHAFQSIFLSVAWFALNIVQSILMSVAVSISFGLLGIVGMLWTVLWLGLLAVVILLMVKAYQGERFKLPIIGDLAEKQA
jgi:uncharacterized membrane protein